MTLYDSIPHNLSVSVSLLLLPPESLLRHSGLLVVLNYQIHSRLRNFICSFYIFFLDWPASNSSIDIFLTPFRLLLRCLHYVRISLATSFKTSTSPLIFIFPLFFLLKMTRHPIWFFILTPFIICLPH